MKFYWGIAIYLGMVYTFLQGVVWLSFLLLAVYSLLYGAGLVIPVAILIDGYFGNFYSIPYLSLISVWWYILVDYVRPRIINFGIMNSKSWQS
jgi:hypothetical protein